MTRLLPLALLGCLVLASPLILLAAPAPADKAMSAPMADFAFQGTIRLAIEKISETAKVRIEVDWNALASSGARIDAHVTLAGKNLTPGQWLDSALAQAAAPKNPLTWSVRDEVVRVTTQRRVLDQGGGSFVPIRAPSATPALAEKDAKKESVEARKAVRSADLPELQLENVAFGDVLEMFRKSSGVNMHVNWTALAAQNVDKSTPVSLQVSGIAIDRAMDLVFEQVNTGKDKLGSVYWMIDDGVVIVSTGSALDQVTRVKTFDVADLLVVVPNFQGPVINLGNNTGANGASGGGLFGNATDSGGTNSSSLDADQTNMAEVRKNLQDNLLGAIKDSIGADMWEPQGKGTIRMLGKQMILSQSLLGFKLMERAAAH